MSDEEQSAPDEIGEPSGWVGLEAWSDDMENERSAAFGYQPAVILLSKEAMERWVEEGGAINGSFSWTLGGRIYNHQREAGEKPIPFRTSVLLPIIP